MKKILIVNFTRMGDLLQSTPLIAGLKRKHPQAEITLAVMNDFRGICSGFPGVDRLVTVDMNHFRSRLNLPQYSLEDHYTYLKKLIHRVGTGYDLVINLSHTNLSAVYSHLTACDDIRGQTMTKEGAVIIRHPWMNYFFNVSRNRLHNSFNLVDMYNLTGDIDLLERKEYFEIPPEAVSFPDEFLKGYEGKFIGFQLGASTEDKRWDPELFGRLASIINQRLGWNIIIFGRGEEKSLLEQMRETYSGPVINALGKTSLPQLAALLKKCELLVTNDTGTMHLATAVGAGVVVLDLGDALAADTGPYTEKALVLEANISCAPCSFQTTCLDHICHRYITPEDVCWAVENFIDLTTGKIRQLPDGSRWNKLKISRPAFEEDGFWNLIPLIKRPLTVDDLLKGLYRRMWKRFLNPEREIHPTEFQQYHSKPTDPEFGGKLERLKTQFSTLARLGEMGLDIAGKLKRISASPQVESLKRLTVEMIMLDNSIYHLELTSPELAPIATVLRLRKNNAEQGDLGYIASMSEILYGDVCKQSRLMREGLAEYMRNNIPSLEAVAV